MERVEVFYTGRVQGVGFRFNACQAAKGMQIFGFVRNEQDGSVRLVAEGLRSELEAFINRIQDSRVGTFIRDTRLEWTTATGEFDSFFVSR